MWTCRAATLAAALPLYDGECVAIVGSGPAGLAAAYYLQQLGHTATLFDQHAEPGGNLRYAIDPGKLPREVLDAEIDLIRQLAKFQQNTAVGRDVSVPELRQQHDAVVIAAGEVDAARAQAMGIAMAGKGLKVNRDTMQTPIDGVFASGGSVMPYRTPSWRSPMDARWRGWWDQFLRVCCRPHTASSPYAWASSRRRDFDVHAGCLAGSRLSAPRIRRQ